MTRGLVLGPALLLVAAIGASAQDGRSLNGRCEEEGPLQTQPRCAHLVIGAQQLQSSIGLAGTWGGIVPGAASTLGKRFPDGPPRFSLTGRVGFVGFELPPDGSGGEGRSSVRPAVQVSLGGGLFEGFRLRPSVGGVLALDLFGTLAWASLPDGTDGGGWQGGVGAKIGVLRESFDVPAITLTASTQWAGQARLLGGSADTTLAEVDPRTFAVRASISKDLGGLGATLSFGRDWYGGQATVMPLSPTGRANVQDADFTNDRWVGAASAALNYLVLFVEGEIGWAGAVDGPDGDGFQPGGQVFGSLSARLIF